MAYFGQFYLDKEKDLIVDLYMEDGTLSYVLSTPNHHTGNLITNLASLCGLPLSLDAAGMKTIRGTIPCYVDGNGRRIYIFRLRDTKIANIFPDGTVERKATIPAISKTLMSQTKDYHLDFYKTVVKAWIREDCKFRTDLHTHMNANLSPDLLIALGICHQIGYPLYYIKKLGLKVTEAQARLLAQRRAEAEKRIRLSTALTGKNLERRIDDHTLLNFASLLLEEPANALWNIRRIRASLAILKDGQAVFTNLEKVYLYRYVFTKGTPAPDRYLLKGDAESVGRPAFPMLDPALLPDEDILNAVRRIQQDRGHPVFGSNTLFEDKLLWIARSCAKCCLKYIEISDTSLVKQEQAFETLRQVHRVMPAITRETGVLIRLLAAVRRIPLTLVKDQVPNADYILENLSVLRAVAPDPYVAGSDIIGEEINDIREMRPVIEAMVRIAREIPGFVIRIHAGENDSLRDNVEGSITCVLDALAPGQPVPRIRIGHGLYTANLASAKGQKLMELIRKCGAVLEFQITSNVRLNNLSNLSRHPLRKYLQDGILCVQGTDGGAIYGTDSIDEQLALGNLLNLTQTEQMQMRSAEDRILAQSLKDFEDKQAAVSGKSTGEWIEELRSRLGSLPSSCSTLESGESKLDSARVLSDAVSPLPAEGIPLMIVGGSFNSSGRASRIRPGEAELIRQILDHVDPEKVFLVLGHTLSGQEKLFHALNRGRLREWAFVPSRITEKEAKTLRDSGVGIRIAIEPTAMGVYKSVSYEIFKRRASVLMAFDGNSAGCNMIQEARNGKGKCAILVSGRSRLLRSKANTLEGYVSLWDTGVQAVSKVLEALEQNRS